jgi:hypothetical protein
MPSWHLGTPSLRLSPPAGPLSICPPPPLVGRRAILVLLHLFAELFHEFLDLLALRCAMAHGVVDRALRAAVIAIGQLTGAFVTSWPPTTPTHGAPASGWLPPAFFFLSARLKSVALRSLGALVR